MAHGANAPMHMAGLEVSGLVVEIDGHRVLQGVDLIIRPGELHLLLGPNGSGKSALLMALMGVPRFQVVAGSIRWRGEELTDTTAGERARRGIGLFHQHPPILRGVTLREVTALAGGHDIDALSRTIGCEQLLDRDLNAGFSGGERKLAELLQLLAQQPTLALLDEPDAGLDADNVAVVGAALATMLADGRRAAVLVTHGESVLEWLAPTHAHVLVAGRFVAHGTPAELLGTIREHGFEDWNR